MILLSLLLQTLLRLLLEVPSCFLQELQDVLVLVMRSLIVLLQHLVMLDHPSCFHRPNQHLGPSLQPLELALCQQLQLMLQEFLLLIHVMIYDAFITPEEVLLFIKLRVLTRNFQR
ncbi:MAG: hypothetical protein EBY07_17235, partial [Actinobacteria bacterium]|nr:hypothetical protein [Actinomycetota bacterium]